MARPSPGAQRLVSILDLFAASPGRPLSLTAVIEALRMNRATCHGLMAELVEANYLYRTSDKRYLLGPAAARLGQAAAAPPSPLQVALPEMKALAGAFDVVCSAVFRDRDEVVVRERVASLSNLDWSAPRGRRWPLRPPFGAAFLAWSSACEAEAWLDRLDPPPSLPERRRMREGMDHARRRGFQFVVRSADPAPHQEIDWLFIRDPADRPLQIGAETAPDQACHLASMSSPVFDGPGRVAFVIGLSGFSGARTGAEIDAIGGRLRDACGRITRFMGGGE